MRLRLGPELHLHPEPWEEDEKILNIQLSEEDFELAKQVNEEEKDKFLQTLDERKVELPEEQKEMINEANEAIARMLARYDITGVPDRVYDEYTEVIPLYAKDYKDLLGHEGKGTLPDSGGMFISEKNAAVMWYKKKGWENELREQSFLHVVSHELLHAKAYRALQAFRQAESPTPTVETYRSGLHIVKLGQSEKALFRELNEGITEILTEEVMNAVINDNRDKYKQVILLDLSDRLEYPTKAEDALVKRADNLGFQAEIGLPRHMNPDEYHAANKRNMVRLSNPKVLERLFDEGYQYRYHFARSSAPPYARDRGLTYGPERQIVQRLIFAISRSSPEYFRKDDEVKKLFVEAYFTGKMLKLGRIIEKTFGKGTFRLIAENPFSRELKERLRVKRPYWREGMKGSPFNEPETS